jgi:hypothetical protein
MFKMITQTRLKELLNYDSDTGIFTWIKQRNSRTKIGSVAGCKQSDGYIRIWIDYKPYSSHRLVWMYVYGELPKKDLDHVNKVKDDNRIVNLRLATKQENKQNHSTPQSNNKSGYLGVSWNKRAKKWKAQIQMNGKVKYLGLFKYSKEAYEVYLKAKRELHTFWVEDQQQ